MEVPRLDTLLGEVLGQLLGQPLGERHHQCTVAPLDGLLALGDDVHRLPLDGPGQDHGFQEARGPDDLLGHLGRVPDLVGAGGGRDKDHVLHVLLELGELQGPVVVGRGEPEAVVHERLLPGPVPVVHPVELGDRLVALVHEDQEVFGEVVQQAVGLLAGVPEVEVPGVVLDPLAVAGLLDHFQVVEGPLLQPVGLQHREVREPLLQLRPDGPQGFPAGVVGDDEVPGRVHVIVREPLDHRGGVPVQLPDPLHLVTEELDPDGVVGKPGDKVDGVPLHPELPGGEVQIVALELDVDEAREDLAPGHPGPLPYLEALVPEVLGVPQPVDAGDGCHDDDVLPPREGRGGREAHLLDPGVDLGVLLDVLVLRRDVGLGLVVVIVGDEVLHPVLGEEVPELVEELGGERLVVGHDQRGLPHRLDDVRHREGLPGAGDAQQGLVPFVPFQAVQELPDRLRLVPGRGEGRGEGEGGHALTSFLRRSRW